MCVGLRRNPLVACPSNQQLHHRQHYGNESCFAYHRYPPCTTISFRLEVMGEQVRESIELIGAWVREEPLHIEFKAGDYLRTERACRQHLILIIRRPLA